MRIVLTFGVGFDKHQFPIRDLERKLVQIEEKSVEMFGGFTLHRALGGWLHPEHKIVVHEDSIVLTLSGVDSGTALDRGFALAEFVKDILDQTSVLIEFIDARHMFV